ncbi:MAG: ferredoxin [Candidatus Omnitrophota bacterium]
MRAKVDPEACTGCELCVQTCPEVFKMEGDKAIVSVDQVPESAQSSCQQSADDCPVTAILIEA